MKITVILWPPVRTLMEASTASVAMAIRKMELTAVSPTLSLLCGCQYVLISSIGNNDVISVL